MVAKHEHTFIPRLPGLQLVVSDNNDGCDPSPSAEAREIREPSNGSIAVKTDTQHVICMTESSVNLSKYLKNT